MTSVKEKNFVSIVIHLKENLELLNPFITELEGVFSQSFENYEYIIVNNNPEHDLTNKMTHRPHHIAYLFRLLDGRFG